MRRGSTRWLRFEAFAIAVATALFTWEMLDIRQIFPIWGMILILLAPDLSMLGYLFGPRIGAFSYNLAHTYAVPVMLPFLTILFLDANAIHNVIDQVTTITLLWIIHIAFDRMLGYGLKETSGFKDTHLGRIGRDKGA